ncbi:MAG TPA: hypothetical protein VGF48_22310 [Thermoanaerobaculia bacterium]
MRRVFAVLAAVFAVVSLAAIALWAVANLPFRRELGGGLSAFDTVHEWTVWFFRWATALLVLAALLRRFRPIYLGALIGITTAAAFWPFFYVTRPRIDRLCGPYEERQLDLRNLAVMVAVTIALALLYAVVLRRERVRALVPLMILCMVLLPLWWLQVVLPVSSHWLPAEWDRPDRLIPFRSCRGALLWRVPTRRGYMAQMELRIDELWERFDDPRGGVSRAVSGEGQWSEGYVWLTEEEARRLAVRRDDPKVIECDSRMRMELVRPAAWHKLGVSEP